MNEMLGKMFLVLIVITVVFAIKIPIVYLIYTKFGW